MRLPTALRQEPIEPELAQRAQGRCNVTMRQAAQDNQCLLIRGGERLVAKPYIRLRRADAAAETTNVVA